MLLLVGYAYDIFNLGFSPWELEGRAFPDYTFYSAVFNYAAGTYGGVVGGNYGSFGGRMKFFTSGNMDMTDEEGNVVGSFTSNFVSLGGLYGTTFKGFSVRGGLSLLYVSLSPQSRGIALGLLGDARRRFPKEWGHWDVWATLDGLGYEVVPAGLYRTLTSFRAYAGAGVKFHRLISYLQAAYYYVGGPALMLGAGLDYGLLRVLVGYDSHYSDLYGGYGRDRLAGTYFSFSLSYNRFHFSYAYNPMGLLGDRHILGVAYDLR
ncbi:MAG: hypothetical protein GXO29_02475 [Thermotogae bacterium]|nr:hypothetical protein [Thermotogota bacterium]